MRTAERLETGINPGPPSPASPAPAPTAHLPIPEPLDLSAGIEHWRTAPWIELGSLNGAIFEKCPNPQCYYARDRNSRNRDGGQAIHFKAHEDARSTTKPTIKKYMTKGQSQVSKHYNFAAWNRHNQPLYRCNLCPQQPRPTLVYYHDIEKHSELHGVQ